MSTLSFQSQIQLDLGDKQNPKRFFDCFLSVCAYRYAYSHKRTNLCASISHLTAMMFSSICGQAPAFNVTTTSDTGKHRTRLSSTCLCVCSARSAKSVWVLGGPFGTFAHAVIHPTPSALESSAMTGKRETTGFC